MITRRGVGQLSVALWQFFRSLTVAALIALLLVGAGRAVADSGDEVSRGSVALFTDAIVEAEKFTVRIETVGGVQPLEQLPGLRMQSDPDDEGEDDAPAPQQNPNQFRDDPGSSFLLADGPTTGIIYSADGYIITSSFNFVREPSVVTVRLPDGRQLPATIVARDKVRKLTLLKVDAENLPTPTWTPREQIRPGQWAVAVGRGLGGDADVSVGVVSAVGRMLGNAIQTDAKLSPVNYGGPLMDSAGRVLGICVPMAQKPGELAGIEFYDAGIGFAVPGWRVHEIAEALCEGKNFYRGWLGLSIDPHVKHGVRIGQMADPSPLRSAGAQSGDMITAINGKDIKHYGQLVQALYMLPAGDVVHVKLLRGADEFEVDVTLARNTELGVLSPVEEPFDPTAPANEGAVPPPADGESD
ncbi:MAG: trypsin-like peptidase domain-containing protein [Phycisphaerales bacterium]|nr:trypsin-like peptidase domain-containing protein [Phycisphaerales bacterium]